MPIHTNNLINETSPYLLQHAHNPVNWYPWGKEALERAKTENKPILVSIGYSACHWCHVMERESFENEETAQLMNDHFINIKIDREERPDLDHIYMDAIQAMTGSGGWPLNVFLTPEKKPFYGGTYFPSVRSFNRPSWKEILLGVSSAFKERRDQINEQAENLTNHLINSNDFGLQIISEQDNELFSKKTLDEAYISCMKNADTVWGGFGMAPKFPQTFVIRFLLQHYWFSKNEKALKQALLSLDKMIAGGIYDQLGGGFARYATDTEWLIPHFEKMLYDNALLIGVLADAYQLTKDERYKEVIKETIGFIESDMMNEAGGFYSALDADSEGVEGKFYVWTYDEIKNILKDDDADIFCKYYDITSKGNWEGKNILRVKVSPELFVTGHSIDSKTLNEILEKGKRILLLERNKRIHPGLDDKIILGWNALMNTACSKSYAATGDTDFKNLAIKNMTFLLDRFSLNGSDEFYHTWKNNIPRYSAFVDDYAFLIDALLNLYQVTADTKWLLKAKDITNFVIENFSDEESVFFFFTKENQTDVIIRKKEIYDGAIPSGNSVMAYNLHHLGIFFDDKQWKLRAQRMIVSLGRKLINYPSSFGMWTCFLQEVVYPTNEIAILGEEFQTLLSQVLSVYIPNKIIMGSKESDFYYPLLAGKDSKGLTQIYLCKDFSCRQPVYNIKALLEEIAN